MLDYGWDPDGHWRGRPGAFPVAFPWERHGEAIMAQPFPMDRIGSIATGLSVIYVVP